MVNLIPLFFVISGVEASFKFPHVMKRSADKPTALGADPCTYGPSYWCSSEEAMRKCNVSLYKVNKIQLISVIIFYSFSHLLRHMNTVKEKPLRR